MNVAARLAAVVVATIAVTGPLAAGGCSTASNADVQAQDAAVGANPGSSAALYMELTNGGGSDDSLLGVSCSCAESTSLHVTEDRDGILLMLGADELQVPSGGSLELHPGGPHIMLEGLREPLVAGSTLDIRLEFEESPPVTVTVPVVPLEELAERVPDQ